MRRHHCRGQWPNRIVANIRETPRRRARLTIWRTGNHHYCHGDDNSRHVSDPFTVGTLGQSSLQRRRGLRRPFDSPLGGHWYVVERGKTDVVALPDESVGEVTITEQ
jgi:hypothetical protein